MEFSREEKTYPPRTMNEIEWDDTQHRFAGAEAEDGYELVMLERRWVEGYPDLYVILCVDLEGSVGTWIPGHITPTGRKYRLEPDEGVPEGEPVQMGFDPAYLHRDKDGDEWECIDGWWVTGGTHDERVGTRVGNRGYVSLPEEYGPYRKGRLGSEAAEQDAEQVLDPTYTYRDKDGDTWEFLNHNWRCTDYGRDATNYLVPPAKYGPYTRIERESSYE